MKKFILAFMLLLGVFGLSANSATITITGNVQGVLDISLDTSTLLLEIDPLSTAIQESTTAVVTEKSNQKAGYEVSILSDNDWKLVDNTDEIDYYIEYDGTVYETPVNGMVLVDSTDKTTGTGVNKNFKVLTQITSLEDIMYVVSNDYEDVLTFTITAK